jgi:hypothetical protein
MVSVVAGASEGEFGSMSISVEVSGLRGISRKFVE